MACDEITSGTDGRQPSDGLVVPRRCESLVGMRLVVNCSHWRSLQHGHRDICCNASREQTETEKDANTCCHNVK